MMHAVREGRSQYTRRWRPISKGCHLVLGVWLMEQGIMVERQLKEALTRAWIDGRDCRCSIPARAAVASEQGLSLCAMGIFAANWQSFRILARLVRACRVRLSPVFTFASCWLCRCSNAKGQPLQMTRSRDCRMDPMSNGLQE